MGKGASPGTTRGEQSYDGFARVLQSFDVPIEAPDNGLELGCLVGASRLAIIEHPQHASDVIQRDLEALKKFDQRQPFDLIARVRSVARRRSGGSGK